GFEPLAVVGEENLRYLPIGLMEIVEADQPVLRHAVFLMIDVGDHRGQPRTTALRVRNDDDVGLAQLGSPLDHTLELFDAVRHDLPERGSSHQVTFSDSTIGTSRARPRFVWRAGYRQVP